MHVFPYCGMSAFCGTLYLFISTSHIQICVNPVLPWPRFNSAVLRCPTFWYHFALTSPLLNQILSQLLTCLVLSSAALVDSVWYWPSSSAYKNIQTFKSPLSHKAQINLTFTSLTLTNYNVRLPFFYIKPSTNLRSAQRTSTCGPLYVHR